MDRVFGIYRNLRGTEELRYLYTGTELVKLENECHKTFGIQDKGFFPKDFPATITIDDLDGMESSFWSNDTYHIVELKSESEIRAFLTDSYEVCDYENPPIKALSSTWSSLSYECMYTGKPTQTLAFWMKRLGLASSQCEIRDNRYQILVDAGMPEEDFSLPWTDEDEHRYRAVLESVNAGTYEMLKEGL